MMNHFEISYEKLTVSGKVFFHLDIPKGKR